MVTAREKQALKRQLVSCLKGDKSIRKIIVFGSFLDSDVPGDMDVAVFQESRKGYLELALKYRKMIRTVALKIPVDIFPVRPDAGDAAILEEIKNGEVIYER